MRSGTGVPQTMRPAAFSWPLVFGKVLRNDVVEPAH